MNNYNNSLEINSGSRVQRAFSNAAFFWLDRTEFPLADFLHACTTHFMLRPDFTSDDAQFILKWIEQQRRNPKSNLNKTLRNQAKTGIETKDLHIVKGSLKAFMSKPKINIRVKAATPKTTKALIPAKKASSKKAVPAKKTLAKAVKKTQKVKALKAKTKLTQKPALKKTSLKKVVKARKVLKANKSSLFKKVKSSMKQTFLRSLKNKAKKRRAA